MLLDHATIETSDVKATLRFFADVFDLSPGKRPASIQGIPGGWLYDAETNQPLVHVIGRGVFTSSFAPDLFNHVGFRLNDFAAFHARLSRMNVACSVMTLPEINERRLFFRTPGYALCEAVFDISS